MKQSKFLAIIMAMVAVVLSLLYIYIIDPVSGGLGGLIFILGGFLIPSLVNLLLTFSILFLIISIFKLKNIVLSIVLFFFISFILGVNTKLPYIFDFFHEPKIVQVQILSQLHKLPVDALGPQLVLNDSLQIKDSLLSTRQLAGNEGCMCMYYDPPNLLRRRIINDTSSLLGYKNIIEGYNYMATSYTLGISTFSDGKYVLLRLQIKDAANGNVIIDAKYPDYLSFQVEKRIEGLNNDPNYRTYILDSLLHDNFWQYLFKVKTPSTKLTNDQIKKLFIQQ